MLTKIHPVPISMAQSRVLVVSPRFSDSCPPPLLPSGRRLGAMIKASEGGGGKGIRLARNKEETASFFEQVAPLFPQPFGGIFGAKGRKCYLSSVCVVNLCGIWCTLANFCIQNIYPKSAVFFLRHPTPKAMETFRRNWTRHESPRLPVPSSLCRCPVCRVTCSPPPSPRFATRWWGRRFS